MLIVWLGITQGTSHYRVLLRLLAGTFTFFPFPLHDKYRVFFEVILMCLHLSLHNHAFCYRNVINHFVNYLWVLEIGIVIWVKGIVFFKRLDFSLVARNCVCDIPLPHKQSNCISHCGDQDLFTSKCLNHLIKYTLKIEIINNQPLISLIIFLLLLLLFLFSFQDLKSLAMGIISLLLGWSLSSGCQLEQAPEDNVKIESLFMTERINAVK